MKLRDLRRWQADALIRALYRSANYGGGFTDPTPRPPSNYQRLEQPFISNPSPALLCVKVPELPELGIPEHYLTLSKSDYDARVRSLPVDELKALRDYYASQRPSSVFCYDKTIWTTNPEEELPQPPSVYEGRRKVRIRINPDGSRPKRVHQYIGKVSGFKASLYSALERLLDACNPDSPKVVMRKHEARLKREAEQRELEEVRRLAGVA